MKTPLVAGLIIGFTSLVTAQQITPYTITERGVNHRVWQKTTTEHGTNRVHKYTEIASGLNYTNGSGQLIEAKEQVDILPDGSAAATRGQHKVYFPPDIYNGFLKVITPDNKILYSRPLGVSYDDGSNCVWIGTLKHSVGVLVNSNKVVYPDAFENVKADLVCTYRRGGFESDLVFREKPLSPEAYDLAPETSVLQLFTEFFNTQDPQQIPSIQDEWFGLQDHTLKFGKLTMGHGTAFSVNSGNPQLRSTMSKVPVFKTWTQLQGRTFLVEQVPLDYVAEGFDTLPANTNLLSMSHSPVSNRIASALRILPPARVQSPCTNQISIAALDSENRAGMVIDYVEINSDQDDFTFAENTTYLVDGIVNINGTATFEPGTIIKFNGCDLYCLGNAVFNSTEENPVMLTGMDDDSVGEIVDGSTGDPGSNLYGALYFLNPASVSNVVASYLYSPFANVGGHFSNVRVDHCQGAFLDLQDDVSMEVDNALFHHNLMILQSAVFWTFSARNITVDQCNAFLDGASGYNTVFITNSIISQLGAWDNMATDDTFTTNDVYLSNSSDVIFKSAGLANYYLAASSPCRNVGTTNINPDLLAQLRTMTTYAPQDGSILDTNANHVDLGYHYPVNVDSDHDGLPDSWEWHWFGGYTHTGSEADANGNTLLYDYQNGKDPNVIQFSIEADNDYVNVTNVDIRLAIDFGTPAYYALFVDSTSSTNWLPFTTTNLNLNLGTTDGLYRVVVGLKGPASEATATWQNYSFQVDRVKPTLTITNPIVTGGASTVVKPYVQIQGFSDEPIAEAVCSVSNALEEITNLDVSVVGQEIDTNIVDFTTNYFQVYDVPLTNGLNSLTLRVTDRAGNTRTTNFDLNLDYTGATAPPAVSLNWPLAGMAVSGTSCTIRGTMSDETGTIVAHVVNGDGTATDVTGIVERNHMFWLENVPLNGTSQISITGTDAAGNLTVSNIALIPAPFELSIDSTPTGDDLYNASGTVSGTVGDPAASVVVNGSSPAQVDTVANSDGTYNWTANDVPVNGDGTATFDAKATGAGGSSQVVASKDVEKGPKWVYSMYHVNETVEDFYGPSNHRNWSWIKTYSSTLTIGADGNYVQKFKGSGFEWNTEVLDTSSWYSKLYTWSDADPDGSVDWRGPWGFRPGDSIEQDQSWLPTSVPHQDYVGQYDCGGPDCSGPIYTTHYFSDSDPEGGLPGEKRTLRARTVATLYTGGKGIVKRKNLFGITAWADNYKHIWTPFSTPIPATALRVSGKQVGADGKLWIVFPDNSTQNITVSAPGYKHFNANADPQKYKMVIVANGTPLRENALPPTGARFCAGQKVNFSPDFYPALDAVESKTVKWGFSGNYVNASYTRGICTNGNCYTGSTDYFLTNSILRFENTYAWWLQGGNPSPDQETATLDILIQFTNGQAVHLNRSGDFNMYEPSIEFHNQQFPAIVTVYSGIWPRLQVGDGNQNRTMDFDLNIVSDFPGEVKATQLVDFWWSGIVHNPAYSISGGTDNSLWLDNVDPYPRTGRQLIYGYFGLGYCYSLWDSYTDAPGIGLQSFQTMAANGLYESYWRFKPDGGDSIYITIGLVTWNWFGNAHETSFHNWVLDSSGIGGPTFIHSHEQPTWLFTYSNTGIQP